MKNRIIYKYPIHVGTRNVYQIPRGMLYLHVGEQNGVPTLWMEVDKDSTDLRPVIFHVLGTGWDVPEDVFPIGSVVMKDGFVWHIYQERDDNEVA